MLPLVLYNGMLARDAPLALEPLLEPTPSLLTAYRPQQGYLLIDERRVAQRGALPERNLSTALFRLEASHGPAEVMQIVLALLDWLKVPEQAGVTAASLSQRFA